MLDWTGPDEPNAPEFEAAVHIYSVLTPFIPTISATNFTTTDKRNFPISSSVWTTANKTAIFASFLNIEKIKDVCGNYGLDFDLVSCTNPMDLWLFYAN
jgi:hypothetical protein